MRLRLARLGWSADPGREQPDESLVSRALVRRLLSEWMGIPVANVRVEPGPGGRPRTTPVDGTLGPSFNATHSGRVVGASLVQSGAIGMDLEVVRAFDRRLLERVFSPADAKRVMALGINDRNREFARLWTIAEACAKATGDGLRLLLRRWQHIGDADRGVWTGGPQSWASAQLSDGHACAIASDGPVTPEDITNAVEVPLGWIVEGY